MYSSRYFALGVHMKFLTSVCATLEKDMDSDGDHPAVEHHRVRSSRGGMFYGYTNEMKYECTTWSHLDVFEVLGVWNVVSESDKLNGWHFQSLTFICFGKCWKPNVWAKLVCFERRDQICHLICFKTIANDMFINCGNCNFRNADNYNFGNADTYTFQKC